MNTTNSFESLASAEVQLSPEVVAVMELAVKAGDVLKKYHAENIDISFKQNEFDPVTIADKESDEVIRTGIKSLFPGDEILSEENPLLPESYEGSVWMVDPLDDTKGYIAGRDSAGVMIGKLEARKPKLGVVYLPFRDEWFVGEAGSGAYSIKNGVVTKLHVAPYKPASEATFVGRNVRQGDVRPIEEAIAQVGFKKTIPAGCIGAKIGLIAAGEAEAFIHTNLLAGKWDTLAAEVILSEAGGMMSDIDGYPLDYTKPKSGWDRYFVAANSKDLHEEIITRMREINLSLHVF